MLPNVPASLLAIVVGHFRTEHDLAPRQRAVACASERRRSSGHDFDALLVLIILYTLKWLTAREDALAESRHPIQCCFVGLVGVAPILFVFANVVVLCAVFATIHLALKRDAKAPSRPASLAVDR